MTDKKELMKEISEKIEKHLMTPYKELDDIKLRIRSSEQFTKCLAWLIKKFETGNSKFVASLELSEELGIHPSRALTLLKECVRWGFLREVAGQKIHKFVPIDPKGNDRLSISIFMREINDKLEEIGKTKKTKKK